MGKATQQPSTRQKSCRKTAKAWTAWVVRVIIYLQLASLANWRSMWSWTFEPRGLLCDQPPRGAAFNRTKLKVLVYSLAKTGTTSTAELLHNLNLHAWHSEEFLLHVWAPLVDRFWQKEENNGSVWSWGRLATPAAPAYKGHSFWPRGEHGSDLIAQAGIDPSEYAEALEKCNVEAMTFDGIENLFWPIYELSPEAKVLMLNWRDVNAFRSSNLNFAGELFLGLMALNYLNCGQHYLPWNALVLPLLDSYLGHATDMMLKGRRPLDYDSLLILLFMQSMTERRICQHWNSGHGVRIPNEAAYDAYWAEAKKRIPKDRLFELNLKKHSPADVCKMLGLTVKDAAMCQDTGRIPNKYPLFTVERERWYWMLAATPWFLFIHWVNHSVTWTVLYWIGGTIKALILGVAALLGCHNPNRLSKKAKKA